MAFKDLRTHLHKLEFLQVDRYILKDRRMLDNQNGLPQIFDARFSQGVQYPWDIKADAQELYNRWCLEVFSIDLLRGITKAKIKGKEDKRSADRIEKDFPGRVLANFHGQGHLINGQWWPTQLCSLRDGAHGSSQGGIFGEAGKGCFSIVLSAGFHYGDIDNGDTIWYSGTESSNETPTENTMRLIETAEMLPNEKQPVRVIRSWNMKKENPYRPQRGFRYDGLYDVVQKRLDEKKKAMYSFYLVRRAGQDPIRYQGVEVRPTTQEIDAYDKLRAADLPVVKW
ncbi:hypothetical protein K432DRAFT_286630 [Lepidopterella palustris CBS 459.81]|uniref:YDG domain-containing protein n=1 Tax=Lepidopterella palustris CBS 459.81 TaxID=1314670 RepID=A0A8E2EK87_9PEZI|nr:hypothetical protein K432DRAFT_286630 [Lepidopterella palustris CBS 459.81]